jgi:hypothetical protein
VPLAAAECGETARSIALISRVWLRHHPPLLPTPEPSTRPAPGLTPDLASPPALSAPPESFSEDAGFILNVSAEAELTTSDGGTVELAMDLVLAPPAPRPPPPPEPLPRHLEARFGGAAWDGIASSDYAASGRLEVSYGWGDLGGVSALVEMSTPLIAGDGPGSVVVQRGALGVGGWLGSSVSTDAQLQFHLSLLAELLMGSAEEAVGGTTRTGVLPGVEFGLLWKQRLVRGLSLWAGPSLQIWAGQDEFYAEATSTNEVITPLVWVGVAAGLGWRFF